MSESVPRNTIEISKATKDNADQIVDILFLGWLATYPNENYHLTEGLVQQKFGSKEQKAKWFSNYIDATALDPTVTYLVAHMNGLISGFLYAISEENNLYLNALYVYEDFHHMHIGSTLLTAALAMNASCDNAYTDVVAYNSNAISFYQAHYFKNIGSIKTKFADFGAGISIPEIRMVKEINPK